MNSKNILTSKTFYFNVLTILVVVATAFGYTPNQEIANTASAILVGINPVINLILRYFTSQPVTILR